MRALKKTESVVQCRKRNRREGGQTVQKQKAPIPIPASVCGIIGRLYRAGYEAWAVGGCVRDSLLGRTPHDWDLCTSALPEQVAEVFRGERLLPTGLAHGTQTLLEDGKPYEITTYRVELGYSDGRHPDAVAFTPSLTEDLARRDFTVNAMACHPTLGLADPFGGQADLQAGVLRAVGDPEQRFSEDALRILRGASLRCGVRPCGGRAHGKGRPNAGPSAGAGEPGASDPGALEAAGCAGRGRRGPGAAAVPGSGAGNSAGAGPLHGL